MEGQSPVQLANALRHAETIYRATFENDAVGIAHFAPDGTILRANATLARILGYPLDELLQKTIAELTFPEDLPRDLQDVARLKAGEINTYTREKRYVRKDGALVWANLTASAVRLPDGSPQFFIGFVEDITRRKAAERELRDAQDRLQNHALQLEVAVGQRTEQLQDVIKELGTFAYSIAHDLRAPLRTIRGFGDLLQTEAAASLSPDARSYLDRIIRSANRMDALITDVLEYSRASRAELTIEPIDLATVVREVLDALPAPLTARARIQVQPGLGVVKASHAALQQCLSNLIGNALKFVRPDVQPELVIRAEPVGKAIRLWVEDNGIGIARENIDRIWGMLERLDSRFEGTGVGLSIVRRAVERMNGRVGVESTLGEGSRFWIELPAADQGTSRQ